jgi:hypothetical protein
LKTAVRCEPYRGFESLTLRWQAAWSASASAQLLPRFAVVVLLGLGALLARVQVDTAAAINAAQRRS